MIVPRIFATVAITYGAIVLILLAWLGAGFLGLPINAFHVFSGAFALLSGCWFALVWPTARQLFPNLPSQALEKPKNAPRQSRVE